MSSRELDDKQQEWADTKMAESLGISYDELIELGYDTEIYDTYTLVRFSDDSNKEILDKISGLVGNEVRLDPWD